MRSEVEDTVAGVAVLAESLGEGQAQEVSGLHQGTQSEGVETAPLHGSAKQAVGAQGRPCARLGWRDVRHEDEPAGESETGRPQAHKTALYPTVTRVADPAGPGRR